MLTFDPSAVLLDLRALSTPFLAIGFLLWGHLFGLCNECLAAPVSWGGVLASTTCLSYSCGLQSRALSWSLPWAHSSYSEAAFALHASNCLSLSASLGQVAPSSALPLSLTNWNHYHRGALCHSFSSCLYQPRLCLCRRHRCHHQYGRLSDQLLRPTYFLLHSQTVQHRHAGRKPTNRHPLERAFPTQGPRPSITSPKRGSAEPHWLFHSRAMYCFTIVLI